MPDLQSLLQQASAMQERLVAAQHELEEARVEGTAGGGLVHATVTGTGELIGLTIDPVGLRPRRHGDPRRPGRWPPYRTPSTTAHRRAADAMGDLSGGFGGGARRRPGHGPGSRRRSRSPGPSAGFVMPTRGRPRDDRE